MCDNIILSVYYVAIFYYYYAHIMLITWPQHVSTYTFVVSARALLCCCMMEAAQVLPCEALAQLPMSPQTTAKVRRLINSVDILRSAVLCDVLIIYKIIKFVLYGVCR